MGLGSAADFNLKEARERARSARQLLADGADPLDAKHAKRAAAKLATQKALPFRVAAERYSAQHELYQPTPAPRPVSKLTARLRLPAHRRHGCGGDQPASTYCAVSSPTGSTRASPWIGCATASKACSFGPWCAAIASLSTNPAKWKGHLDQVLPAARKVALGPHHPAVDYRELPGFMAALRGARGHRWRGPWNSWSSTASRSGEVLGARWDEIDLVEATWTIPAGRMKAKREHRVPLSPAAVDLLAQASRRGRQRACLCRLHNRPPLPPQCAHARPATYKCGETVHGFRSSFRTWCSEQTNIAREVAERALAHIVGSQDWKGLTSDPICSTSGAG